MATILFSSIADGAVVAFDPLVDTLVFDDAAVSAASLAVSYAEDFTAVGFSALGISFTLTPTVSLAQLSSTSVTFADGSRLLVGDDSTGTNDILANTLIGTAGGDQLIGLSGADTLAGGSGGDVIDGGSGADLMRGGLGADSYVVDNLGDLVDDRPTTDVQRASTSATGVEGNFNSGEGFASADGRWVAFHSTANNLVAGDGNVAIDVFVKDMLGGTIQRVSTTAAGTESSGGDSFVHSISPDGRYVVFHSLANNLVSGDGNFAQDVFLKDVLTGAIQRVSLSAAGAEANGASAQGRIADGGRYVVFESLASNLVAGDTNGANDIFVKDLLTGAVTRANTDAAGQQANASAARGQISADGRWVLFDSNATNLLPGDTSTTDVFLKDLLTGALTRLSANDDGVAGNGFSSRAQFSGDGRLVVFDSSASNLAAGESGGFNDIFVKNLATGEVTRVSTDAAGAEADGASFAPDVSADGRWLVFESTATNLVAGDTNGMSDVFVKDLLTGAVQRITVDATGVQAGAASNLATISADGRWVLFRSGASNLVGGDGNGANDTFRVRNPFLDDGATDTVQSSVTHTLADGVEQLLLTGAGSTDGIGNALDNRITGNGAANRLDGRGGHDTLNGGAGADTLAGGSGDDVYFVDSAADVVTEFDGPDPVRASTGSGGQQLLGGHAEAPTLSADGSRLLFASNAANVVGDDTNQQWDFFVKDLASGAVERVSLTAAGVEAGGAGIEVVAGSLSADGRWVAFGSYAPLVPEDVNGRLDLYVRDLATGALQRVSVAEDGSQLQTGALGGRISADGRQVLMLSADPALVGPNPGVFAQLVVKDLATGAVQLVSAAIDGGPADYDIAHGSMFSGDGRQVLFHSAASNLVAGDTAGFSDVFVHDLDNGSTTRVSTSSSGAQANGASGVATISSDGRWVAFFSSATNLVAGDTNGALDIFVKDLETGATQRVSTASGGAQGNGSSYSATISADGRWVAFLSDASNLVAGDTNASTDLFIKDLQTGAIRRVSTDAAGNQVAGSVDAIGNFSADGSRIVFTSAAADYVDGDTNGQRDVFIALNPFVAPGGGHDTVRASVTTTLADHVERLVLTGSGAFTGTGNALGNVILGNGAANALIGGGGADTLKGGAGNDRYVIGDAGDRVVEAVGGGNDLVQSSIGYTLTAQVERLTLTGSASIDGSGNGLANQITGNAGANVLDGRGGADTLTGGEGNDGYVVDHAGDVVVEAVGEGTDTVFAGIAFSLAALADVEHLTLTGSAAISATGNGLGNVLTGNAGSNLLDGGAGNDTASYANATAGVSVSLALAGAQATGNGSDTLVSIERLTGSAHDDTLIGNAGANLLDGGAGADLLAGGAGNDSYVVDSLADLVLEEAGQGTDLVQARGSYRLGDEVENLTLLGSANSAAVGNALDNLLTGNAGSNLLSGGAGSDTASYANAGGAVTANLATGLATGFGSDTLVSIENLLGSASGDTLTGNASANRIDGGAGLDTLAGGGGADLFRFSTAPNSGTNADVVSDFNPAADGIELENAVFTALAATGALAAANFVASSAGSAVDADDYLLYDTDSGELYYDSDGSGAAARALLATFTGNPLLSPADLFVS